MKKIIPVLALLFLPLVVRGACSDLSPNATMVFRFDDNDATPDDETGNGWTTTTTGTWGYNASEGKLGGSYYFYNGRVETVANFDQSSPPFCFTWWWRTSTLSKNDQVMIASGTVATYEYLAWQTSPRFRWYDGVSALDANPGISADTWYFAAACNDGATLYVYHDGNYLMSGSQASNVVDGLEIGEMSAYASNDFWGHIDMVQVFSKNLSVADIGNLYNAGSGCDVTAVSNPVVSWEGYTPANNTRNNYSPWPFYFNVTSTAPEYCELYDSATYKSNVSSVVVDTKYSHNVTLTDGSYSMQVRCTYSGNQYNSSVKYVTHDETQPGIDCVYPKCDNSSIHINATPMTFKFDLNDSNLDGYNITVWRPDSSVFFANITDNLTGTAYSFSRTLTLDAHGNWTGRVVSWDDANALSSEVQKQRVADYSVGDVSGGKVLHAYKNDIMVTSLVASVGLEYNGMSWSQVLSPSKAGEFSVFYDTDQPCRIKYTGHKAHLVCGYQYIHHDGIDGDVRLVRHSATSWEAVITPSKGGVLRGNSIGELNVNTIDFGFYSNAPPVFNTAVPDMVFNESVAWTNATDVVDADGDSLSYWVNDSVVAVDASGVLSGTPAAADNGNHSIEVKAGDDYSNVTDVFHYYVNVSAAPGRTFGNYTFVRMGECPTDSTGRAIVFVGLLMIVTAVWIFGFVIKIPVFNMAVGFVLLWGITWQAVRCIEFLNILFIAMGLLSILYGGVLLAVKSWS